MKSALLPGVTVLLLAIVAAAWPIPASAPLISRTVPATVSSISLQTPDATDWSDCLACHVAPDADLPPLSAFRPAALGAGIASCEDCHTALELAVPRLDWTHPVRSVTSHLPCTDCHVVSAHGRGNPPPRPYGDYDSRGCFNCHRDISASMSKIFSHGPSPRARCRDCHPAHQPLRAALPAVLLSGTAQQAWSTSGDWWTSNSSCLGCHPAVELFFPLDKGFVTLNTFNYHERHVVSGKVLCVECHDPHGSTRQGMVRDTLISGEALFFNERIDGASCTVNCHGIDHESWRYINAAY